MILIGIRIERMGVWAYATQEPYFAVWLVMALGYAIL